ncbi:MAG: hypothetical protein FJ044_03110, partial [Candidatus Cloacimonetes bacterium]|nr:hypothetical protein [Candidatus Cloacimonadota bacterium]
AFSFQSFGIHKPKEPPTFSTPQAIAQSYLSELGLWDDTLVFTTTYQRTDLPGLTFVEFHRSWEKVGLPILNIVGMMNVPEEKRLSGIALASQNTNPPDDPRIINVSNGLNGKERPNDFNTITVGVGNDGRILFIDSNLRKLEAMDSTTNLNFTLKTPQEVLLELEQGKGIFSLIMPTGEGVLDFNKVYPENIAHGKKATINDFLFAYLEKANGVEQKFLQPMYVFRGTSTLDSGYHVQFVQAIPAIKMQQAASGIEKKLENFTDKVIPSAFAYIVGPHFEIPGLGEVAMSARGKFLYIPKTTEDEARSIDEIRTLFFNALSDQYTMDVARKLIADENLISFVEEGPLTEEHMHELFVKIGNCDVGQAPFVLTKCELDGRGYFTNQMENVAKLTAQNVIEIFTEPTPTPTLVPTPTVTSIPTPTVTPMPTSTPTPTPEIFEPLGAQITLDRLQVWAEKLDIFPEGTITLTLFRNPYGSTPPECYQVGSSYGQTVCYITGTETSPSIYVYPQKVQAMKVEVGPISELTYVDPGPFGNNHQVWEVTSAPDGKLDIGGVSRERLYYEYKKISFPEPTRGWVIESDKLDEFLAKNLLPQLGLNQKEKSDLLADVHTSLLGVGEATYLKVSLVDQIVLDKYLPLNIISIPNNIYRIHLMFTPIEEEVETSQPEVTPIIRNGFIVVETGVVIND